jgi:pimeloyl-ACP methyl ester carboxylesterase
MALDLPGHGRSDWRPPGVAYHFVDFTADVAAAADVLAWDRFDLVGHSMGAGVACLVAGTFPERVRRLVLLEGLGPMSAPAAETPARLRAALDRERALDGSARRHPDVAAAVEARMRDSDLDQRAAGTLVARSAVVGAEGVRFRHDPRLKSPSRLRLTEAQVLAFLGAISCPVLAVRADRGWPFPASYLEPRLAAFRDLATVEVSGGHHVHLTHPGRIAPHVVAFLA